MLPILGVLAEVCREAPLCEKIVVVPSLAIGHQIGDALARSGTPWVNLRFETTRTIADAIAGFDIARAGLTVLSRAQALAILERACDGALDDSSYFADLRGRPGLYRAIQRSLDDLRHAGLRELPPNAFEDPRKASDLARILGAYEEELRERKFIDRFGVLLRAIEMVRENETLPWPSDARWVVADDLDVSSAESQLVSLVAGREPRDGERTPPSNAMRATLVRVAGEENEIRHALRHAAPFDDCEILYTTRDPYLSLAYELASEHAIPATFAEGIPAAYTRPGQAALGFLRWIEAEYDATQLQKVARAGVVETHVDGLSPFALAIVLRRAKVGWGRERYVPRLEAHIASLEKKIVETDSEARAAARAKEIARARLALDVVRRLLDTVNLGENGAEVSQIALAQSTLAFLNGFAATKNENDGMALAALRRMLAELTRLPEATALRSIAIERLRDAVADVHVGASNPRPGHLHVAPIRSGGWSGRRSLFVVGLDDSKHPGSGLQDPILLDAERTALNDVIRPRTLDLLGDAPSRASARLHRLFARVPDAQWTLCWPELDLSDRRAGFPSRDVLEVHRAIERRDATFDDLVKSARRAGFLEESRPLSVSEWWLGEKFVRGRDGAFPAADTQRARWRAARESNAITEFDGLVQVKPEEIDPRLTGKTYSASQIEQMARCPFGWFLERVLRIEPVDDLERIQDQWLDPLAFGNLVHKVLERTMLEIVDRNERISFAGHRARMHEIAAEEVLRIRSEIPPDNEIAFARQREELLETCDIFLRKEESLGGRIEPRYFELAFGGPQDPFAIPLGGGREVKLRGYVDRVDRDTTTGDWEVWDYKTGGLYDYDKAWDLKQGTKLQHVIYTRALEHVLERRGLAGRVQCAGYYFPTPKGRGERNTRTCGKGQLENALNALFDVVSLGFFPQPDEGRCSFCPYPEICGDKDEVAERMQRKQEANAGDRAVRRWRELQEIE